jgi:hypothetical protein
VALAFWLPYAFRAGFVYDDWSSAAGYRFNLALFTTYRPIFALWEAVIVRLFHTAPVGYYLSLALLMSAMGAMAVVALDGLGVPSLAAMALGLLLVVSPYADSLGLWWTASQMSLAMVLGLAAVAAGSRWIDQQPHANTYLGASLVLLVLAILTYEAVAPIVLLPVALIGFSPNRRRVLKWSIPAAATGGAAALFMFTRALSPHHKTARPLSQYGTRIETLLRSGTSTLLHHLGGFITLWSVLAACVIAALGYAGFRMTRRLPTAIARPWQWTVTAIEFLLAGVYVAWLPYVPANDYYIPEQFGIGNRINLLAQLFFLTALVLALMALIGVHSTVSGRTILTSLGVVIAVGIFGGLFASFFAQTHQDQNDFLFAKTERQTITAEVKQLLPRPAHGDEIILAGYHLTASPQWVPVLSATWDTTGDLDLLYNDGSITAQPASSSMSCAANGLAQPLLEDTSLQPYGRIVVVDLSAHRVARIRDQSQCRRELPTLTVNPDPILASPSA